MANKTQFLGLTKPGFREYTNSWHTVVNENSDKIDTWAEATNNEITEARFSKGTLKEFLAVAHATDGSLQPTPEVVKARSSAVYGNPPVSLDTTNAMLFTQISYPEWEIWRAREGQLSLRDGSAYRQYLQDCVVSGARTTAGLPNWMGSANSTLTVTGTIPAPVMFLIDGHICRVRYSKGYDLSAKAASAWYKLYAKYEEFGCRTVDGTTKAKGVTVLDLTFTDITVFSDPSRDFTALNVQPGDVLEIFNDPDVLGKYVIKAVPYNSDPTMIQIVGLFPKAKGALNYEIRDPIEPSLGHVAGLSTAVPDNAVEIGGAYLDSSKNITDKYTRHFKDTFVGDWRAVASPGNFSEIWQHQLLTDVLDIAIQVSQTNDGTAAVEELSLATLYTNLGVAITDNKTWSVVGGTPALTSTGSISAALTGVLVADRSAMATWDRRSITVKNAVAGRFYRDFNNAQQTSGFVRVVVRKRG